MTPDTFLWSGRIALALAAILLLYALLGHNGLTSIPERVESEDEP